METKRVNSKRNGFSIVELLTVMGIIAILISLLVPALAAVRDKAMELKQKAQFHSIKTGLELYKSGEGGLDYPESDENFLDDSLDANNGGDYGTTYYCGANKLAEALVGLDYLGFHPDSNFRSDGCEDVFQKDGTSVTDQDLYYYATNATVNTNWQTEADNIKCRSFKLGTPFLEQEGANAFLMDQVYDATALSGSGFSTDPYSMVLCDMYTAKRESGVKTGTPILYYKARTQHFEQDYADTDGIEDDIYYYPDNESILSLGSVEDSTIDHPLYDNGGSSGSNTDDLADFQRMILDKQLQLTGQYTPYRKDSYILISAGKDSLFGTADDITNFETNN